MFLALNPSSAVRRNYFPIVAPLFFIEVIFMILAWKILGAIGIITLVLIVFVALFDSEDGKHDDKKEGEKNE